MMLSELIIKLNDILSKGDRMVYIYSGFSYPKENCQLTLFTGVENELHIYNVIYGVTENG